MSTTASSSTASTPPFVPPVIAPAADQKAHPGVQAFANALAQGNTRRLVSNCWTFAPARVIGWVGQRNRILNTLADRGGTFATERGVGWKSGATDVFFSWAEVDSPFGCPTVMIQGDPEVTAGDVEWLVHRAAARLTGTPVNALDTEGRYPIIGDTCELGGTLTSAQEQVIRTLDGRPLKRATTTSPGDESWTPVGASRPTISTLKYGDLFICDLRP